MPLPHNITRHNDPQGIGQWSGPAASDGTLYFINRTFDGRYRAELVFHHNPLPPYFYADTLDGVSKALEGI